MKTFRLILFLFCALSAFDSIDAQDCPPDDVLLFTNQISIDEFATLYPNCTEIKGTLIIRGDTIEQLNGLSQLISIQGGLSIQRTEQLVSLEGLNNLQRIGNNLRLSNNTALQSISALSNIDSLPADLYLGNNNSLTSLAGLQNLQYIKGGFTIFECTLLESLEGLDRLQTIGGRLYFGRSHLKSMKGLDSLSSVGGEWYLSNNHQLTSLEGLNQLAHVGGMIEMIDNPLLTDFEGLNNLESCNGTLQIDQHTNLVSLSGLEKLQQIAGNLYIFNNPVLSNINAINNLDHHSISFLHIGGNSLLSVCNIDLICHYIEDYTTYAFNDNAAGCNNGLAISNSCDKRLAMNFQIFYDKNQNKIRETDEPIIPYATALLEPGAKKLFTNHDQGGNVLLEPGSYSIAFDAEWTPDWELSTDSAVYHFDIDSSLPVDTLFFGIRPTNTSTQLIPFVSANPFQCRVPVFLEFGIQNTGTTVVSGTNWINLPKDADVKTFSSPPDTIHYFSFVKHYGWHFTALGPGEKASQTIELEPPSQGDFDDGERVNFNAFTIYQDANGIHEPPLFEYNDQFSCTPPSKITFKVVTPNRPDYFTLFGEDLVYTIRFQSYSDNPVSSIFIRDTLDPNLDPSTFKVINTSHPELLLSTMTENRHLTFELENINFPDNTQSIIQRRGFITYQVRPYDGLPEPTTIHNTATLIYDLEPPFSIGNTTTNILVSDLTSTDQIADTNIRIYPNPTNGLLYIISDSTLEGQLSISNLQGQEMVRNNWRSGMEIDLSSFPTGLYLVSISTPQGYSAQKILKQ